MGTLNSRDSNFDSLPNQAIMGLSGFWGCALSLDPRG